MDWVYVLRIVQREEDSRGSSNITQVIIGTLQMLRKQSRQTKRLTNDGLLSFLTIQIMGRLIAAMNIADNMPNQTRSRSGGRSTSRTIKLLSNY